jgi:3-dehydroquinate dehydratase / shikimate dehydrogenase
MASICVPVCVRDCDEIRDAMAAAARAADIVELRVDCLTQVTTETLLAAIPTVVDKPVIITLRSAEEGGRSSLDRKARRRFWLSLKDLPANCLVDLELDLVEEFSAVESAQQFSLNWNKVICSRHDFASVPDDLEQLFARMSATPAGIIKLAVQPNDAHDCLPIFKLLETANRQQVKLIAIGMGETGLMTRILGPSRGSFLTYGSIDSETGTAPGQIPVEELRDLYRIDQIDRDTDIYGIIGQPVAHSFSPHIHNAAFTAAGLNAVYIPFEVHDVLQFIKRMVHPKNRELEWRLRGLSVTAPHKSKVMQSLEWIDPVAQAVGAVNTIVVRDDELHGYNLDATGFIAPLLNVLGEIRDLRCAVLGAGGAARACVWALKNEGAEVTIFGRDDGKAELLAMSFGVEHQRLDGANFRDFDLVVNATPLGTRGKHASLTPATAEQLRGVRLAYDLVYNPAATRFICEAREAGCEVWHGIEMLLAQAIEQFKLWTGRAPDLEVMRAAVLPALER